MTHKKSTVFYLSNSSGEKYKNSESITNFWTSRSPVVLALRESPSKGQCKTTLPERMLQETPLSRIINPLYTAVPLIVKALPSICHATGFMFKEKKFHSYMLSASTIFSAENKGYTYSRFWYP